MNGTQGAGFLLPDTFLDGRGRPFPWAIQTAKSCSTSSLIYGPLAFVPTVFKSSNHPEGRPRGLVYTQALVQPIGACTAPLMIGATAAALQGQPAWGYLVWGFPAALLVATLWTHFRLSSTPAELHFRPGQVSIRSVQDVLTKRPLEWHPLHNVRAAPEYTEISVGWNTQICRRRDWQQYEKLKETAQRALHSDETSPSFAGSTRAA